jgi:hypothetical protein
MLSAGTMERKNCHPEEHVKLPLLAVVEAERLMTMTGHINWAVALGRHDIQHIVSELSRCNAGTPAVSVQGLRQKKKKKLEKEELPPIDKHDTGEVEQVRQDIELQGYAVVTKVHIGTLDCNSIQCACNDRATHPAGPIFTCQVHNEAFIASNHQSEVAGWTKSGDGITIVNNKRWQTRLDNNIFDIPEFFMPILKRIEGVYGGKHVPRDPASVHRESKIYNKAAATQRLLEERE